MRMIIINIWIQSLNRLILFLFVTFISFYAASDDAASENVEIEVIEIIGSQEKP